ncbi:anion transporter [Terribacillus halophilus]|uniref:Anion transporter n=1 Tax=Terribacillus halophilus TaxID=361279 RepID=A0A1G6T513_9BACI|nr:SLC13 family permease [Terribacillus halophilus]SDD23557.1 anion transporter [Terribacillus halophilus]
MEQINRYRRSERNSSKQTGKYAVRFRVVCLLHICFFFIVVLADLDYAAKVSLFAFLSAMTLWTGTKIPAGFIAISLISLIVFMKAATSDLLYNAFSEDVVWLMFGAFIIGEAIKESGLAARFSRAIIHRAKNKHSIIRGYTFVLGLTALFIPSTSGRAALSMPIIKQLAFHFSNKEKQFLAILTPVVILMSTSATLIGAGSHLIGVGLLEVTTGKTISFFQWLIWGIPFTIVITILTMYIVKLLLWPKSSSISGSDAKPVDFAQEDMLQHLLPKEKKAVIVLIALIIGWVTEDIHGYDTAFVTIIGSILLMIPRYGIISWKQGIKAVSWNLLLFVAAATALGHILVDTGVIGWMEREIIANLHSFTGASEWTIVLILSIVTVTSHLYITSHTTRAIVFIPSLIIFGQAIGADLDSFVFLSLIGMNYCVTFPVSSKALLLFYEEGDMRYNAQALLKISIVLMPIYIFVILLFYFTYWKWTGLSI